MVLLQNLVAQILVPGHRDNNLAASVQVAGLNMPLSQSGGLDSSDLEDLMRCQRPGILGHDHEFQVCCKDIPNVLEEQEFWSSDNNSVKGMDMEELRSQEHDILVV
jgi:hypothetical protein